MSLEVTCGFCHKPIEEAGGIVFGPPQSDGLFDRLTVEKRHVCRSCYSGLVSFESDSLACIVSAMKSKLAEHVQAVKLLQDERDRGISIFEQEKLPFTLRELNHAELVEQINPWISLVQHYEWLIPRLEQARDHCREAEQRAAKEVIKKSLQSKGT